MEIVREKVTSGGQDFSGMLHIQYENFIFKQCFEIFSARIPYLKTKSSWI